MSEPCVTIGHVAERYGISKSAVRASIKSGEIPSEFIASRYQIRPSTIPPRVIQRWQRTTNIGLRRWGHLPTGPLIYFIVGFPGFVKIGFTADLAKRMRTLQVACPVPLQLAAHIPADSRLEREYHTRFAVHRCEGEWFRLVPEIADEIARLTAPARERRKVR